VVALVRNISTGYTRIVFVSGIFNVVHPGHLRLLNFAAECGDFLIVGVSRDSVAGALIPEDLRLEGVAAIGAVDFAFLLPVEPEEFVSNLKPNLVVKGKEHEVRFNPEQRIVDAYGGKLIFSSGEVRFSSLDLLKRELIETNLSTISKPTDFLMRHRFSDESLLSILTKFKGLRVIVIGDLIVDEYVTCEPLGMSQEDPTIVVSPIKSDMFIGGAAIVAAHAAALGAHVDFFSVVGDDPIANFASKRLCEVGVKSHLTQDSTRPTTLKKRYRARGKTLLRVSHLRQHDISQELMHTILADLLQALESADLLVFSDFSYGCLTHELVDSVVTRCAELKVPMVADSQSSSQVGDIARFKGMLLISPTEHEARLAMRDTASGLVVLANALQQKAVAKHVMITMGSEGVLVHSDSNGHHGLLTDQLPAMNTAPRDVAGAGDCLMVTASMALVAGASVWESAYLGSIAAACQVGRVGNLPLTAAEIIQELIP
jgi:rfaE bifunctional protein kinase chain/domain